MVFLNVQCAISRDWHKKRHHTLHICYTCYCFQVGIVVDEGSCGFSVFKSIPSVMRRGFSFILFHLRNHFLPLLHLAKHSIQYSFGLVRGILGMFLLLEGKQFLISSVILTGEFLSILLLLTMFSIRLRKFLPIEVFFS